MYSTFNEGKAVVIERFNRTLKKKCLNILLQMELIDILIFYHH